MLNKQAAVLCYVVKKSYGISRRNFSTSAGFDPGPGEIPNQPLDLSKLAAIPKAPPLIDPTVNGEHYDVAVIGGGTGGLAFVYVTYNERPYDLEIINLGSSQIWAKDHSF